MLNCIFFKFMHNKQDHFYWDKIRQAQFFRILMDKSSLEIKSYFVTILIHIYMRDNRYGQSALIGNLKRFKYIRYPKMQDVLKYSVINFTFRRMLERTGRLMYI